MEGRVIAQKVLRMLRKSVPKPFYFLGSCNISRPYISIGWDLAKGLLLLVRSLARWEPYSRMDGALFAPRSHRAAGASARGADCPVILHRLRCVQAAPGASLSREHRSMDKIL